MLKEIQSLGTAVKRYTLIWRGTWYGLRGLSISSGSMEYARHAALEILPFRLLPTAKVGTVVQYILIYYSHIERASTVLDRDLSEIFVHDSSSMPPDSIVILTVTRSLP